MRMLSAVAVRHIPLSLALVALAACTLGCAPAPRLVECRSLDALQCVIATDAVQSHVGDKQIARLAVIGSRGCLPLPVSCPLPATETPGSLRAVAAVEFVDPSAGSALFDVGDLDLPGWPEVSPMAGLGADAVFGQDLFLQ